MYGRLFCQLYDEFGWNEYPRTFCGQLMTWLDAHGATVRRALDLGCGTGVLCQALHAHGIEAEGIDLSPEMIDIARHRAPNLRFTAANMVTWRPDSRFDLLTCTGDAVNHIFDLNDVSQIFQNVHGALNDGGFFIFDALNAAEVPSGEPFEADTADGRRVRFHSVIGEDRVVRLTVEIYDHDALACRETILEKLHDVSALLDALRRAGLQVLQCGSRLNPESLPSDTWFIVAQKPAGAPQSPPASPAHPVGAP